MAPPQQKRKSNKRKSKYNFIERPCFKLFIKSIKSPDTRYVWANYIHNFMAQQKITDYDQLLSDPPKLMQARLMEYVQFKIDEGRLGQSIGNHLTALWHFFWINEKEKDIAWDRVRATLPEFVKAVDDVPYTHEQIKVLGKACKQRMRIAVYSEALGGPRIGGIAALRKGDLTKNDEYGLYRVLVYRGTKAAYVTFFGIEASKEIDEYFAYRERCGEPLNDDSPLIREEFKASNKFAVEHPKMLSKRTLERQIGYAAVAAGLRTVEKGGGPHKRKKNMLTHGLRKFFKQQCRRAGVDPINLEYLVGHKNGDVSVGVTKLMMTYDPAAEEELLQEYLKAMDNLTINEENRLKRENVQLKRYSDDVTTTLQQATDLIKQMRAERGTGEL